MPAECEVFIGDVPCGVLARGRCERCGAAYCGPHGRYNFGRYICVVCDADERTSKLKADMAAGAAAREAKEREAKRRAAIAQAPNVAHRINAKTPGVVKISGRHFFQKYNLWALQLSQVTWRNHQGYDKTGHYYLAQDGLIYRGSPDDNKQMPSSFSYDIGGMYDAVQTIVGNSW